MNNSYDGNDDLTLDGRLRIESIAEEFVRELREGRRPCIDDYVARVVPGALQERLREELVGETFEYRYGPVDRYRPIAELGEGAFGRVYKAWDETLDRLVALKVLNQTTASVKSRFLTEARRQASLKHSHIVTLYHCGELPKGNAFIAMECIDGGSLRTKLNSEGTLAPQIAARLMEQVALGISAVHQGTKGTRRQPSLPLVHQDLKPENVLLDGDEKAYVADFGLAAAVSELHSGTAGVGGTAPYMSPEQALWSRPSGDRPPIDTRADVWALGAILFELLTGHQPFVSHNSDPHKKREVILEAIIRFEPPQPRDLNRGIPPEIDGLIKDCLKKSPGKRVQSAEDVAKRLRKWLDSVEAIPDPLDFAAHLAEARRDFTDRPELFDQVDAWPAYGRDRLLLVVGEVGSGKSAFLSDLIERNPGGRIVAWHLCRHDWPDTRKASIFVRSIAGMLAQRVEAYRQALESSEMRDALRSENCEKDPISAFEAAVVTPIAKAMPTAQDTFFIVVDALDEANLESDATIPGLLASWEKRLPPWLRVVASVRRGDAIEHLFASVQRLIVDRENEQTFDHVRRFLKRRLDAPNLAERLQQARCSASEASDALLTKSEANFLYVAQALESIERDRLSFDELDKLPPGLDALYEAFFKRRWPTRESYKCVRPVLEVLTAAYDALPAELAAAASDLDDYGLDERLNSLSQYLDRRDDGDITFHHQFIKDWLIRKSVYRVKSAEGHARLSHVCGAWPGLPERARDYALRYVMTHLISAGSSHGAEEIGRLLRETQWIYSRLELHAAKCESARDLLPDLNRAASALGSDLDLGKGVRATVDWLMCWSRSIDETRNLLNEWWHARPEVPQMMGTFPAPRLPETRRLLVPIVGPALTDRAYPIQQTTKFEFHIAVCEVLKDPVNSASSAGRVDQTESFLVFAAAAGDNTTGHLRIYHRPRRGVDYEASPRVYPLPLGEKVLGIAPLRYPNIAVFVRRIADREAPDEIRVIDLTFATDPRTVRQHSDIVAIEALPGTEQLIVVTREARRVGAAALQLQITDATGVEQAEAIQLPFDRLHDWGGEFGPGGTGIVPFASDSWGIVGHDRSRREAELHLYRLRMAGSATVIQDESARFNQVRGACALPHGRLGVTHLRQNATVLSVLNSSGDIEYENTLFVRPARRGSRQRNPRGFLSQKPTPSQAYPVGFHKTYGLVLADDRYLWTIPHKEEAGAREIRFVPEAIPELFPSQLLHRYYGESYRAALGISSGRVLLVYSQGALVIGPGSSDVKQIENGPLVEPTTEILGPLTDGELVVCDGGHSVDGIWLRFNQHVANPPFIAQAKERTGVPLAPNRVTKNGWELGVSNDDLVLRKTTRDPGTHWTPTVGKQVRELRIEDYDSTNAEMLVVLVSTYRSGYDYVWLCIVDARSMKLIRSTPLWRHAERWTEESAGGTPEPLASPAIVKAEDGVAIIGFKSFRGDVSLRRLVDLQTGRQVPIAGNSIELMALPQDWLLLLIESPQDAYECARCFLYRRGGNARPFPVDDLEMPVRTFATGVPTRVGADWLLGFVSIADEDWHSTIETGTLRFAPGDPSIGRLPAHTIRLPSQITAWTRSENQLVLGYNSGRVEIRRFDRLDQEIAVGFVSSSVDSLAVVKRCERRILAVAAGGLTWFDLSAVDEPT